MIWPTGYRRSAFARLFLPRFASPSPNSSRRRGRAKLSVREIPCAFERQEGEEALYQFAERIQGLLDVADKETPNIVAELEAAIRVTLTAPRSLADAEELNSGW